MFVHSPVGIYNICECLFSLINCVVKAVRKRVVLTLMICMYMLCYQLDIVSLSLPILMGCLMILERSR